MTSVLLFVEPLIERDRPYWKDVWVTQFARRIAESLRAAESERYDFRLVVSEPIQQRTGGLPGVPSVVMQQRELTEPFGEDALNTMLRWLRGDYTDEQLNRQADLFRDKLGSFVPDVVITWSPAPYLRRAYPDALILHHEYSLFSRCPFPETWFFDPEGMIGPAFLLRHHREILESVEFGDSQRELVREFKRQARDTIRRNSPFDAVVAPFRARHRRTVILPLQFSQFYLFDGMCRFKSQFEYLTAVLDRVPRDVGVIVTLHPQQPGLEPDAVEYVRGRYPNLLLDDAFSAYNGSSDYLMPFVDAVVTVSSKVGFLPLIWDNRLISLGRGFLDFMADATNLDDVESTLRAQPADRDVVLYWLMSRFSVPDKYLTTPAWLSGFLGRSLSRFRAGSDAAAFFDPVDTDDRLFRFYHEAIRSAGPARLPPGRVETLETELAAARGESNERAAALRRSRNDFERLLDDRREAGRIMDEQAGTIRALQESFDNLRADRTEAQRILEEQGRQLDEVRAALEDLRSDRANAQRVMEHQAAELDRSRAALDSLRQELTAARNSLEDASCRAIQARAEADAASARIAEMEATRGWRMLVRFRSMRDRLLRVGRVKQHQTSQSGAAARSLP